MARFASILFVVLGLAFGGCLAGSQEDDGPVVMPIYWEGNTGSGACAPTLDSDCYGYTAGANSYERVAIWGNITGNLTLKWAAVTPQAETFEFTVFVAHTCWAFCASIIRTEGHDPIVVRGSSPLEMLVNLEVPSGNFLAIHAATPDFPTPDPAYGRVDIDQGFRVQGILTAVQFVPPLFPER